jgi:hypothetical protein
VRSPIGGYRPCIERQKQVKRQKEESATEDSESPPQSKKKHGASLFLQYDIGLTIRKVARMIAGLAQFAFVPGSLLRFGWEAGRKAQSLAQDVAEKLRACEANHADETHYRIDGRHGGTLIAHSQSLPTDH